MRVNPSTDWAALVARGKDIFRFDTFGDETQWTDTLKLNEVISAAVDPTTALSVGLKVDAEALPQAVADGIKSGSVDVKSAATIAVLKLNAVVASGARFRPWAAKTRWSGSVSRAPCELNSRQLLRNGNQQMV